MNQNVPAKLPAPTTADAIHALHDCGYWYCGRCGSLIPLRYWHRCDDTETHSAPSDENRR
jgi:hypothetical protein